MNSHSSCLSLLHPGDTRTHHYSREKNSYIPRSSEHQATMAKLQRMCRVPNFRALIENLQDSGGNVNHKLITHVIKNAVYFCECHSCEDGHITEHVTTSQT